MAQVTVGGALSTGWSVFKHNAGFLALVAFVMLVVIGVLNYITNQFDSSFLTFIMNLVMIVVTTVMSAGMIHIYLGLLDGKKGSIGELFTHTDQIVPLLIVNIVAGIAVFVGTILLIIPGLVAAVLLLFAQYLVIDKKMKPMDAIKHSMELAKPNFWMLLGFIISIIVLNVLGALALLVGLLITVPVSSAAMVYLYRQLVGGHGATHATPAVPQA